MTARLLLCFLLLNLVHCTRQTESKNPIIATINSDPVLLSTFLLHFNRAKESVDSLSQSDPKTLDRLKQSTLNKLIFQTLIEQEAVRRQIIVTGEELDRSIAEIKKDIPPEQFQKNLTDQLMTFEEWKDLHRQKLLSEKVARVAIQVDNNFAEEEIVAFYEKHRDDYTHEPKVRARQIYVTDENLAEDLFKRLRAGASFEELAKKHSLSPDAKDGGDLDFFKKDEKIPEFNLAFELQKNQLHPKVIKSPYGYHLLKMIDLRPAKKRTLAESREDIRAKLLEEREERAYKQWLEELVSRAKVLKNEQLMAAL